LAPDPEVLGSKTAKLAVEGTNLDYWDDALLHLRGCDPILAALIDKYRGDGKAVLRANGNPFRTIVKAVTGQQISVKAADAVWKRLEAKVGGDVRPKEVSETDVEELRGVGLSMRKAEYIRGIGQAWMDSYGQIDWKSMPEETARTKLQALRGVGPWTVDMVMMFAIGMPDILPLGDIGMIRAIEKAYAKGSKLKEPEIKEIAKPWTPYRTVATWYLWRSIDAEPVQY